MMPTVLGLMGLSVPEEVQGKDLSDPIIDKDEDAVAYLPIWMYTQKNWRGVITPEYTYARAKFETDEELNVLFDRKEDPHQMNNLFGEPAHAGKEKELAGLTQQWMSKYGDRWWEMIDFRALQDKGNWREYPEHRPVDLLNAELSYGDFGNWMPEP